jgi:hypothetical protein
LPVPDDDPAPIFYIESVSPAESGVAGGVRVEVRGNRFSDPMEVFFGETPATEVVVKAETLLTCDVPPNAEGVVDVRIVRGDGKTSTLKGAFRYRASLQVHSVDPPALASSGGTPFELRGQGFAPGAVVLIGGRTALNVVVADPTRILGIGPEGLPGPADVFVHSGGEFAQLVPGVSLWSPIAIHAAFPPVAGPEGGELVTLSGEGLSQVDDVSIGGLVAPIRERWADDSLLIEVPPLAPGVYPLAVSSPWSGAFLPGGFVVASAQGATELEVLAVVPNLGPESGGQSVGVVVGGLSPVLPIEVRFGGALAELVHVEPNLQTLWVVTPPGAAPWVDVTVSQPGGATHTLQAAYRYQPVLAVTSISPAQGPAAGGDAVVIDGVGFGADAVVQVGALPAESLSVLSDKRLEVVMPPGAPGPASVRVQSGGQLALSSQTYEYVAAQPAVYASKPAQASIAGGAFMRVYGVGFVSPVVVRVGGAVCQDVVVHDSTLVTATVPPGAVGTVDVEVDTGGETFVLSGALTYFNPTSSLGGTWGGPLDESLNVAVVEGGSGLPVPNAFVMLGAASDSPFRGNTDENGLVTFGGPGLRGRQVVTAAKAGYVSNSILDFDATNATLVLIPYITGGGGGGGGNPVPDGEIAGRVLGMDKYTLPPLGSCANKVDNESIYCDACVEDADCGQGARCISRPGEASFCTTSCAGGSACPPGYFCGSAVGGGAFCYPSAGTPQARCYTSTSGLGSNNPDPGPLAVIQGASSGDWPYVLAARPGEVAVVCEGGYVEDASGEFVATRMGFARHVFVTPGGKLDAIDVPLDYPLSGRLDFRLDAPPVVEGGPDLVSLALWLELGTDGFVSFGVINGLSPTELYSRAGLPEPLTGALYDARWLVRGGSQTGGAGGIPYSLIQREDIDTTAAPVIFQSLPTGAWEVVEGAASSLFAVSGSSVDRQWVVGEGGVIYAYNGGVWSEQPSPVDGDLRAVHASGHTDATAVGSRGAVARFDGVLWKAESSGTDRDLRAVWTAEGDFAVAAGWYQVLRRGVNGWSVDGGAPEREWLAASGTSADDVWLVGAFGAAAHFDGEDWEVVPTPTAHALRGIWCAPTGRVYAVGDKGAALEFANGAWLPMPQLPTTEDLLAVHGRVDPGALSLYAVGAKGSLFRFNGAVWAQEAVHPEKGNLGGVYAPPGAQEVTLVGSRALVLGPFMQVPKLSAFGPAEGGGVSMLLDVPDGVPPHFRYGVISLDSGLPLWIIVARGDVVDFRLPDLAAEVGLPPLGAEPSTFLLYSAYKEGFDIDAFTNLDFRVATWLSWSLVDLEFP